MRKKEKARLILQQRWDHEHKWDDLSNEEVCQRLNHWVIDNTIPEKEMPKSYQHYQEDVIYELRQAVKNPNVRPNVHMIFGSKITRGTSLLFMDKERTVNEVKILSDLPGAVKPGYIKFDDGTIRQWRNRQPKFYVVRIVTMKPTPRRPPDLPPRVDKWPKKQKIKIEKPKIPYVKRADRTDPVTGIITGMGEIRRQAWREMGYRVRPEPARKKIFYNPDVVGDVKAHKRKIREADVARRRALGLLKSQMGDKWQGPPWRQKKKRHISRPGDDEFKSFDKMMRDPDRRGK